MHLILVITYQENVSSPGRSENNNNAGEDTSFIYTINYDANGASVGSTVPVYLKNYTKGQTVIILDNTGNFKGTDSFF